MSTETRVPGVSAGSIALNACAPASMSSAVAKYWSYHRRPLLTVVQDLEAGAGHTGRRPVGRLDAGQQPLDSLGLNIAEPDDTHIHGSDLHG